MDAIELIMKDHDRVEELFARFKGGGGLTGLVRRVTGNVPARERRTAVEHICRELDVHTRVEEEILYPAAQATAIWSAFTLYMRPSASPARHATTGM